MSIKLFLHIYVPKSEVTKIHRSQRSMRHDQTQKTATQFGRFRSLPCIEDNFRLKRDS